MAGEIWKSPDWEWKPYRSRKPLDGNDLYQVARALGLPDGRSVIALLRPVRPARMKRAS